MADSEQGKRVAEEETANVAESEKLRAADLALKLAEALENNVSLQETLARERDVSERVGRYLANARVQGAPTVKKNLTLQSLLAPWEATKAEMSAREFARQFQAIARAGGWEPCDEQLIIGTKCVAAAADFIRANEGLLGRPSMAEFWVAFLVRFTDPHEFDQLERQLAEMGQLPGEATGAFADRVRAVGVRLLEHEPEPKVAMAMVDRRVLAAFTRGLRPLVSAIVQASRPTNLEAATALAEPFDRDQPKLRAVQPPSRDTVFPAEEEPATVQAVQDSAERGAMGEYQNCWRCSKSGHIARNCKAKADEKGEPARTPRPPKCYRYQKLGHIAPFCSNVRENPKANGTLTAPARIPK